MSHIEQLRQVMIACNAGGPVEAADDLLAATYPPACQTCDGTGRVDGPGTAYVVKTRTPCPDCPTIADLLAWGVAVATAERAPGGKGMIAHWWLTKGRTA